MQYILSTGSNSAAAHLNNLTMNFKHTEQPKDIELSHQEIAQRMGDLYYDSLADFLNELSQKIKQDAEADNQRNRLKLSEELYASADLLASAAEHIQNAWEICEPFVREWEEINVSNRENKE